MSPAELRRMCERELAYHASRGTVRKVTKPHIYLTLRCPRVPGRRVRLLGQQGGPVGELCVVHEDDGTGTAVFDARAILRWLDEHEGNDER